MWPPVFSHGLSLWFFLMVLSYRVFLWFFPMVFLLFFLMFFSYGCPHVFLRCCLNLLEVSLDVPVVFLKFTLGLPVFSP